MNNKEEAVYLSRARKNFIEAMSEGNDFAKLLTAQDLIYYMQIALSTQSAEIEKLRMEIGDRDSRNTPSTSENDGLVTRKDLREPLRVLRTVGVKVDGQQETVLDANRADLGKKLNGLNVEEADGRHKVIPRKVVSLDHLTAALTEIEKEVIDEIVTDSDFLRERMSEESLVVAWERCRGEILFKVMQMIRTAIK